MIELATLGALAAFTLIGPPIKRGGEHAHHNPLMVWLPDDATTLTQGQHPEGRRVQEVGEWRFAGMIGLVFAGVAAALLASPLAAIGIVVAYFAGKLIAYTMPGFDEAGHGAEIMVAEADGYTSYYIEEIVRMLGDPDREGMTFEEVYEDIMAAELASKIMVKLAW